MNKSGSSKRKNRANLGNMKYEIANQLGVNLKQGYNGDLSSKEAGSIGGEMVKQMVDNYSSSMGSNNQ